MLLLSGIAGVLMAIMMTSCTSSEMTEQEKTLVKAVRLYNSQLRLAYLEVNLNHMAEVATRNQLSRLFPTFQSLRSEDAYMRAEQETFEVEQVRMTEEGRGYVDTTEKWVFWWQDHQTNEITKPQTEIIYHMRYDLVPEGGTWKVDKLEDLDEKE